MMGPGKPRDTQSNFQSRTDFLTTRIILRGVMVGPDGYFRGSSCPVASILHLDVCTADVDNQNSWRFCHLCSFHRCSLRWVAESVAVLLFD